MSFISVFLTVNSFLLKLDVGKFIGVHSLSDPITSVLGGASLSLKTSSSGRALGGESLVILENLIVEYNPICILINIIELILLLIS